MDQEEKIKDIVSKAVGTAALYFDQALNIQNNGKASHWNIWGISVSERREITIMDEHQNWHPLHTFSWEFQSVIIHYLYQRIKTIPKLQNIVTV